MKIEVKGNYQLLSEITVKPAKGTELGMERWRSLER